MSLTAHMTKPIEAESIKKQTVAEQVAASLRQRIVSGQLPAGTKLRQVEIAERFGVSTTPVREAFGLLQAEGLLRIETHKGVTVFLPSVQDLVQHYEIRTALETLAATKVAERFCPQDAPPLLALLDKMETLDDAAIYVAYNRQFHLQLYRLADRPRLLTMIEDLRNASNAYIHLYAAQDVPRDAPRLDREHREILAACQANDPARAANAIRHHLQQTVTHVINALNRGENARS